MIEKIDNDTLFFLVLIICTTLVTIFGTGCSHKTVELQQCKDSLKTAELANISLANANQECVGYLNEANVLGQDCIETLVVCYEKLEGYRKQK